MLVRKHHVKVDKVAILTHYRAQRIEIEKLLSDMSHLKENVSTIVLSQGMCNCVLCSDNYDNYVH